MRQVIKFWHLPAAHQRLLIEAALWLLVARVALRVIPFRHLVGFFERRPRGPEVAEAERERLRQAVQWAIHTATRHLPGTTVCFPKAIAAQALLRQRGVGATLYYGAATRAERGLTTHVWVQDGAQGIVGHLAAREYCILAHYPKQTDSH